MIRIYCVITFYFFVSCYTSSSSIINQNNTDNNISENIWFLIDRYYYTYFEYPEKVDNLIEFSWDVVKSNYIATIFLKESDRAYNDFIIGSKKTFSVLNYMIKNQSSIEIRNLDGNLSFINLIDSLYVIHSADICSDLSDYVESRLWYRGRKTFVYNSESKEILYPDYDQKLKDIINEAIIFFSEKEKEGEYLLLKYTKDSGELSSVCKDVCLKKDIYISKLQSVLMNFVKDKNDIHSLIILMPIPSISLNRSL